MGFTNYLRSNLLDHVFGSDTFTPDTNLYIGLSTTTPTDDGTNITEPDSVNGYGRVQIGNNLVNWNVAVNGNKTNGADFEFDEATGSWGTITHFFIADDPTGGNIVVYGELTIPKLIDQGDTARFRENDIEILLS